MNIQELSSPMYHMDPNDTVESNAPSNIQSYFFTPIVKSETYEPELKVQHCEIKSRNAVVVPCRAAQCHMLYLYLLRNSGFRDSAATSIITIS